MASNYPAGAEHDPNAPYNQVDYKPRPHEVELSVTFRLYAPSRCDAKDDVKKIDKKLTEFLEKLKGISIDDVCVEVTQLNADYYDVPDFDDDEDEDYDIYGDYFDDYDSHGDYYFHDED